MHLARVRIRVRVRVMVRVRVRARARARVRCEQCTAQAPCGLERVGVRLLAVMRRELRSMHLAQELHRFLRAPGRSQYHADVYLGAQYARVLLS